MIYLIGGAPRLGKSVIARQLSKKLGIPWVSTDFLWAIATKYTSARERRRLWPIVSGFGERTAFANLPLEKQVRFQFHEARSLWTALFTFVHYHVVAHDDYILKGVHLTPRIVARLKALPFARGKIRALVIVDGDEQRILRNMLRNTSRDNWMHGASQRVQGLIARFDAAVDRRFERDVKRYRIEVLRKSDDFNHDIRRAVRKLTKNNR